MGPKKGLNSKAADAKAKKEEAKTVAEAKKAKESEDKFWEEAGDGKRGPAKAQAKKEEQAKKAAETAARKAELKKLADEEAQELAAAVKKGSPAAKKTPVAGPKVTAAELRKQQEEEKAALQEQLKEKSLAAKREVSENSYTQQISVPNINREEDAIDARSVQQALDALTVGDDAKDQHPEKRAKAAFAAYSERELAALRQEKPGLKLSQYKDMVWRQWQKSPENPLLQSGRV